MVSDIEYREPINDNEIIWRYMDFPSFYSLVSTKELFFRRLDKYTDQYEGTLPEEVKSFLVPYWASMPLLGKKSGEMMNTFLSHLRELNTGTLSNSWVNSPTEIYAMWKIYLRGSQEGVAIQTTVGKLRKVLELLPVDVTLAKVTYEVLPWNETGYNTLAAWKTKSYSYEHELRALIYHQFTEATKPMDIFPKEALYEHGTAFPINVENLIENVYISPFSGPWFYDVVVASVTSHMEQFNPNQIIYSRIKDR